MLGIAALIGIAVAPSDAWAWTPGTHVFLGDASEFRVRIGEFVLQSRTHPELRARKGEALWVRIEPDRCVVLAE